MSFNRRMNGARAVTGNALNPRGHRGNTQQVDTFYTGITPSAGRTVRPPVFIEFFVVAGGGGGGAGFNNGSTSANGGTGGGGGGTQTNVLTAINGTYTVTVGAGGNYGPYPSPNGSVGGTSSVVDPASATVATASGGGGGQSNANPATNGTGGTGSTWTGGTGNASGGTASAWTGTNTSYSYSGTAGVGNGSANPGDIGAGGNSGGGNPFAGSFGMNGSAFVRLLTTDASKITGTTGSPTTFTSGSYTYYKWTASGTLVMTV